MRIILLSLTFLFLLGSCSISQKMRQGIKTIEFGTGGGFTGLIDSYVFNPVKKEIFKKGNKEKLIKLSNKEVKMLLKLIDKNNILTKKHNTPFNTYTFIHFKTDSGENYFSWGDPNAQNDTDLLKLYNTLLELTKK